MQKKAESCCIKNQSVIQFFLTDSIMERGRLKEMFSPEIEKIDRKTLRQMQLERLKHIVRYAYENVPMYRKRFDAIGLKPEHIRTLKDIEIYLIRRKTICGKIILSGFLRYR